MTTVGAPQVIEAIVSTCDFTNDRNLSKEALTALKWHGFAWWAVPRSLALTEDELRLIGGVYFRAWVCELRGVNVDGHIALNETDMCQQCGQRR